MKSKKTLGNSVVSVVKVEKPESQQMRSVERLLKSPMFEDGLGSVRGVKIKVKPTSVLIHAARATSGCHARCVALTRAPRARRARPPEPRDG